MKDHKLNDLERLDSYKEYDVIQTKMKEASTQICVYKEQATVSKMEVMFDMKPNAIHFSGHGLKGGLILEAQDSSAAVLDKVKLSEKIK